MSVEKSSETIGIETPFVEVGTPVQEIRQEPEVLEVEAEEIPRVEDTDNERVVFVKPQEDVVGTVADVEHVEKMARAPEKTIYTF